MFKAIVTSNIVETSVESNRMRVCVANTIVLLIFIRSTHVSSTLNRGLRYNNAINPPPGNLKHITCPDILAFLKARVQHYPS